MSRLARFKSANLGGSGGRSGYSLLAEQLHKDWFSDWVIGGFNLPVGKRSLPTVLATSVRIPDLGRGPITGEEDSLSPEIDRRDKVLPQTETPKTGGILLTEQQLNDALWLVQMGHIASVEDYVPPVTTEPAPTTTVAAPTTSTTTSSSMDLGSIITDLGTAYIQTKYAPTVQTVGAPPTTVQPAYDLFDAGSDVIDFFTAPDGTVVPVKKKKKCRRRRRRLATVSDIKDLAALRSVLGNGEAFKTWIATHSR